MKRRVLASAIIAMLLAVLVAGTALAEVKDKLTEQGNKCRITVGTIKSKASDCDGDMALAVGEMLSTALANEDRFIVLASQEEVAELADEIALGQSGLVEEGREAEGGLMEGADLLITGAVTSFEPQASGGGGLFGAAKKKLAGEVGVSSNTAKCGLDLKLIDIRTRRVIKAFNVEAKSTSWETGVAGSGWVEDVALAGALGSYSNQPMEDAVRAVLVKAIERVAKEVPKEYYRYTGDGQYTQEYAASAAGKAASGGEGGGAAAETGGAAATGGGRAASSGGGTPRSAENMALYTNYDFVPGDKVIFFDDFSREEAGEFPSRWRLVDGVFEIARKGDKNWVLCTNQGKIIPDIENLDLPETFTLEMETYDNGEPNKGHYYRVLLMQGGNEALNFWLGNRDQTSIQCFNRDVASKTLPNRLTKGRHTMRIMVTRTTIKCYIDAERVGNVPKPDGFDPDDVQVYLDPYMDPGNPMLMGAFRLAGGGKKLRDQLDQDGKIVTHGILFDSGSAVIKAESYKTLADIGALLTEDAALRLSIEGHTDGDGADDANLTLSKQRADAVKDYLVATNRIDAGRLETKGQGKTQPIDNNTTAEGKANNRRVELVKL
jgi:curli biogenesis system outer membrane secretion channel CsgG